MLTRQYWLAACTIAVLELVSGQQFDSSISPCPARCDFENPTSWTYYYDLAELDSCDGTSLFQLNVNNAVDDPNTHVYFRACTVSGGLVREDTSVDSRILKRQQLSFNRTVPESSLVTLSTSGSSSDDAANAESALDGLKTYLQNGAQADTILFSRAGQTVAGLFSGSQVDTSSAEAALSNISSFLSQGAQAQQTIAQACGSGNGTISPQFFGVAIDTTGDVAAIQGALRSWKEAECVTSGTTAAWDRVTVNIVPGSDVSVVPSTDNDAAGGVLDARSSLQRRDTCRYTQVQAGDGCFSVAQRCGIPQSEMEGYNRNGLCTSLKPDEYVCCSSGDLPDFSPQPGADGRCVAYTVEAGDTCFDIAEAHQMTVDDILARNTQTWGWMGCENILLGAKICLSTGTPPFPAEVSNAVCGPQAPLNDTSTRPTDPDDWIDFNPCPLKACCNIWGQCGITSEFCTVSPSETGNPGTAAPGSNGCVSNCGTEIVTGPGPANFEHIGYYESYHIDRPCNFMSISDIPDKYTIVHWAFGDITDDFRASISPYENDWNDFKAATGFKRIVSFGGWAFSTERSSYYIFRQGVLPANRQTFANNMADFVQQEGLDGIDFDWEYPGAPDDQGSGIPVDAPERGLDYLEFLKLVRAALPSQYTIGIAAPASFWYLKAFPIAEISEVVDYIVYMTYDLHGQWDYGNKWTSPGCPNGNCLRSHINQTETETALSMVTKAGVPANKLLLGQALYGRSFKMSSAGCYTEECTFTGPSSGAAPGRCTGVGGYLSNLEIREIIEGGNVQEYYTEEAGDILVYDDTEWVSWAKESTYDSRTDWARGLGLGGISDWAIDLDITGTRNGNGSNGGGGGGNGEVVLIDPSIYSDPNPVAFCQPPCTFVFPPWQLPYTTTISPPPVTSTVVNAWTDVVTRQNPNGATTTETLSFTTTTVTVITIPAITTTAINVWNWVWSNTDQSIATLTSSLQFPPLTLTQSSTVYAISQGDEETTIGGAIYTFLPGPFPSIRPTASDPSSTSSTTILPPGQNPTITTPGQTTPNPPGQTQPPGQTTQPPPPTSCGDCPPTVTVSTGTPGPICDDDCGEPCEFGCSPPVPCFPLGLGCNCIGLGCDNGPCLGLGCVDFPGGNPPPGGFPPPPGPPPPTPPPGESPTQTSSSASSSSTSAESCPLFIEEGYTAPLGDDGEPTEPNVDVPIPGGGGGGGGGGGTTSSPVITTRPTTSSSISYISCSTQNQQPGQGITRAYCVCDGSTFPQSTATSPPNSCAYTSLPGPSATISITRLPTGPTITRPTDPPTPTPVPNDYTFVILAREIVVGSIGGAVINWSWVGITVPIGEELSSNFCNQNDFPQAVRKGVGRSSPPKFPDSLGPFDLETRDDCTYEGDPDGPPGKITCGSYEATCLDFTGDILDCAPSSGNPARDNYYFALRCFYR